MFNKKVDLQEQIVSNRELLIKEDLLEEYGDVYKKFNKYYSEFCDLNDKEDNSSSWAENGKEAAIIIARDFDMSKAAFKRAVGHLMKAGKVEITDKSIRLK